MSNSGLPRVATEVATEQPAQLEKRVIRKYYTENDYLLSPEGILKVSSALVCVVSGVVASGGAWCPRAPRLAGAGFVCCALCALLYVGVALQLPLYAPETCLYMDIILSTVMGVLLMVLAALSMTVCDLGAAPISYLYGALTILSAGLVVASAVITYVSVMRLRDAAAAPRPRATSTEQDA